MTRLRGEFSLSSNSASVDVFLDGKILNHRDLASGYQEWGIELFSRLQGNYALAIHDGQARKLILARDVLGTKPLYYFIEGQTLYYSANFTQLSRHSRFHRAISEEALVRFFARDWTRQDLSFYENLWRLPPGHFLVFDGSQEQVHRHSDLKPPSIIRYKDPREYAEHFQQLATQAVKDSLNEDGPPTGILLSGGLDSSSIVGLSQKLSLKIEAFSCLFDHPQCSDQGMVKSALALGSWPSHLFYPERDTAPLDIEWSHDYNEIYYATTAYMFRPALQKARARGLTTIAMGIGIDEALTPNTTYLADLLTAHQWSDLIHEAGSLRDFLKYAALPNAPGALVNALRKTILPRKGPSWLNPRLLKKYDILDRTAELYRASRREWPTWHQWSRYMRLFVWGGYSRSFEQLDELAQLYELELSYPLLDSRLFEFALSIPLEILNWRGKTKIVLREAMKGILPDDLRLKEKFQDFSPLANAAAKRQRHVFNDWHNHSLLLKNGILERAWVDSRWNSFFNNNDTTFLFDFINMEKWLRTLYQ